jgi:hypothetical protein
MTIKVWTNLEAASRRRRYCVLACLSSLTAKLYAGEEYAAGDIKKPRRAEDGDENEDEEGEDEDEEFGLEAPGSLESGARLSSSGEAPAGTRRRQRCGERADVHPAPDRGLRRRKEERWGREG